MHQRRGQGSLRWPDLSDEGMFQVAATRRGLYVRIVKGFIGSQKKMRARPVFLRAIRAPICWSPPSGPLRKQDGLVQGLFQPGPGGTGGVELVRTEGCTVVFSPFNQFVFLMVMGNGAMCFCC